MPTPNEMMAIYSSELDNVLTPSSGSGSSSVVISPDESDFPSVIDFGIKNEIGLNYENTQDLSNTINSLLDFDNGSLLAGVGGDIYKSMDYGETWRYIKTLGTSTSILSLDGMEKVYAGASTDGTLWKSTDYGETWSTMISVAGENEISKVKIIGDGTVLFGTSTGGKVYKMINYSTEVEASAQLGSETKVWSFAFAGSDIVVSGTEPNGKVFLSANGGQTWQDQGTILTGNTAIKNLVYCGSGIFCGSAYPDGKIIYSTNYGQDWTEGHNCTGETDFTSMLYAGNGIVIAGTNKGTLWMNRNRGIGTWELKETFSTNPINDITINSKYNVVNLNVGSQIKRSLNAGKPPCDLNLVTQFVLGI